MKLRFLHTLILTVMSIGIVASCNYRDINFEFYQSADILLRVDWDGFTEEEPTGISVYCYPSDTPEKGPYLYLSNNVDSVKLSLPVGKYNILVFNQSVDEFGSMRFTGMERFETASAVLEDYVSKWKAKSDDERTVYEPEWLGVDVISEFVVTQEMVDETAKYRHGASSDPYAARVDAYPQNVVQTVDVRVRLYGIDNAVSARGTITGMAASYYLGLGMCGVDTGTNILENWSVSYDEDDKKKGYVSTQYRTFGLPEDGFDRPDDANRFYVSFLLRDNKTICDLGFSVGNWFIPGNGYEALCLWTGFASDEEQAPSLYCDPAKPVRLPETEPEHGGDAGFDPTIGDWDDPAEVDVDVK